MIESRKLIAAIACRNKGSRLYGKPLQNLNETKGVKIIDNIIDCLTEVKVIDNIVLGISEGNENIDFIDYSNLRSLPYILGSEEDVLERLIQCGESQNDTDIFRLTSESPFPTFSLIESSWKEHLETNSDATFLDDIIDGCGFEIIKLEALKKSHKLGERKHRSELASLYIRENLDNFNVRKISCSKELIRKDLRLTVDNAEDLIVCKAVYKEFEEDSPNIDIRKVINFLDNNNFLKELTHKYTEKGYESMYIWRNDEKK